MRNAFSLAILASSAAIAATLLAVPAWARHHMGVTYIPAADVTAAFMRGAVLLKDENYMIHASRREGPGQAEIHVKDADLIYVLDGAATLVTGGSVPDAKTTEPDEMRGSGIQGGEPHALAKGDVMVVPAGTPHWFKEVKAPFLYYVVKVR